MKWIYYVRKIKNAIRITHAIRVFTRIDLTHGLAIYAIKLAEIPQDAKKYVAYIRHAIEMTAGAL